MDGRVIFERMCRFYGVHCCPRHSAIPAVERETIPSPFESQKDIAHVLLCCMHMMAP